MSHRPYIKNDDSGNMSDLAIDAETLQGYKPCVNIVTLEDNNSTTAGTWLAKTNKVSALVDGQLFLYKITVAGASTTKLNITGSGGSLGAKIVYRTGTTKLTTQYAVGHYILLAYNSLNTCFRVVNDYDANSYAYVRQYQHGQNAAGATNLYPILTRYNLTNKNGTYDNAYARFYTDTYIDVTNGYLYAPKVYSGGSEVAVKTDIPTETTVSNWGFTKNVGTVTKVNNTSPDSNGNVSITLPTKSSWNYDDRYIRFDTFEQNLTDEQQANARFNIGAASWDFSYNDLQDLPIGSIKEIPYTVKTYTEDEEERMVLVATLIEKNEAVIWYFPSFTRRKPDGPYISGTYKLYAGKLGGQYSGEICTLYGGEFMMLDRKNYGLAIYNSKGLIYAGEIGDTTSFVDRMYIPAINESDRESNLNLGSVTKPVYLMRASYTDDHDYYYKPCSLYAGGTKVTLNGTNKGASDASFYAPTSYGSSGQFLKSAGENAAPTWETVTIPTKASWNYDDVYVKYNASQSLTDAQKTQARSNIGAGTSSLAIGTTASTAAAGNHTHSTTLATDSGTATVTMDPDTTYKLSTGGTNVIFKTPSDAYKLTESLRKGYEEDTSVGYYKIATINHVSYNFCQFTMIINNTYSGTVYTSILDCRCSDNSTNLNSFALNIISGTNISNKLAYLYTYDSSNNLIKIEIFIHCTRFEHPICYILNARPGQQLVIPTQDEFNKATPDKPEDTTMTGHATYSPVSGGTNGQLLSTNGSSLVWVKDNRSLLHHDLAKTIEDTTTDKGWKMFNDTYDGFLLKSLRFQSHSPAWGVGDFGSGIVFGGGDTKGVMSLSYGKPQIKFAGGNGNEPKWWVGLTGTSGASYNLDNLKYAPTTAGTSGYSLKSNGSGAPRWANEADVYVNGTVNAGVKNNSSISILITNQSKPLKKGVWRYSGKYGVFLIFATTEITTPGGPRTEYICGYVSSQIPNSTSLTLVEV